MLLLLVTYNHLLHIFLLYMAQLYNLVRKIFDNKKQSSYDNSMSVIQDVKSILGKTPPPQAKESPKTILIVEDDEILREMYKDKFIQEDFAVLTAVNGKEGLEKAIEQKPNIIILDLMMPV